jgi:hypothetical protein
MVDMKRVTVISTLLILAMASAAFAQSKLYNHVDTPATIHYNQSG